MTAGTEMTGKVICGIEKEERGAGGKRKADRQREEQDIRGGGVLSEFELIRQHYSSPVRFCVISLSNVCV